MAHTIGGLDEPTREALRALGSVLRELRGDRGLSQRALADRVGLSQSTISRVENGLAEGIRVAWIARLLAGLDTEVRILPDHRPLVDRSRGFRKLRQAFDGEAGGRRRWERELRRRSSLDAILEQAHLDRRFPADEAYRRVPRDPLDESDYPTGITTAR